MKMRVFLRTYLSLPTEGGFCCWGVKWGYGQPDWPVEKLKPKRGNCALIKEVILCHA